MSVASGAADGVDIGGVGDSDGVGDALTLATALARPSLDEEARAALDRLAPAVDAGELLRVAHDLGVGPLVASHLADGDADVPERLRAAARDRCRATGARNLAFVAELHRVLTAFDDAGLRCLAYKGPVVAVSAYGDLSRRDFSDLDLFVPTGDAAAACAVLESLGYVRWTEDRAYAPDLDHLVSRAAECTYLRVAGGVAGDSPTARGTSPDVAVELRWRLGSDLRPTPLSFEDAWARRAAVTVGGRPVPTFDPEDTLLVLAGHGAKHHWSRLGWAVDAAAFVAATDVDWDRLLARADGARRRRVLLACLSLAAETAGAPVPERILRDARADPAVRRAVAEARAFVASNPGTAAYEGSGRRRRNGYELRLCDSRRDRARACLRLAVAPRAPDYAVVSLSDRFAPLYRVVRPARHAADAVRRRLPRR